MALPSQVRVDGAMTGFSLRYSNPNYIADGVFPMQMGTQFETKDSGKYFVHSKGNLRVEDDGPLGPRTPAPQVDNVISTTDFTLGRYALKDIVLQEEVDNADQPNDPEEDTTLFLTDKLQIGREFRAASTLFNASNVANNVTLAGTDQWSDNQSDPIGDINTGKNTLWTDPNSCTMGGEVWDFLRNHPNILGYYKHTDGGAITPAQFAALIGVDPDKVFIGTARRNSAAKGQSAVASYIWGKYFALSYTDPNPRPRTMTAKATLQRGESRQVTEWPANDPEGTWKKVQDRYVQKLIAADLIYLIIDAVA